MGSMCSRVLKTPPTATAAGFPVAPLISLKAKMIGELQGREVSDVAALDWEVEKRCASLLALRKNCSVQLMKLSDGASGSGVVMRPASSDDFATLSVHLDNTGTKEDETALALEQSKPKESQGQRKKRQQKARKERALAAEAQELADAAQRASAAAVSQLYARDFQLACKQGSVESLRRLLAEGVEPDAPFANGKSPLIVGSENGKVAIVRALLAVGADGDKCDRQGNTPLHAACARGCVEAVELLLDYGVDKDKVDGEGHTALCAATKLKSPKAIKLLLAHGVDGDKAGSNGYTPLRHAVCRGNAEAVELLLGYGVDKDKTDERGWAPYFLACHLGCAETAAALSRAGASMGDISELKHTIARSRTFWSTFCASWGGDAETVKGLLEQGAADWAQADGRTLLAAASARGCVRAVSLLLEHGGVAKDAVDDLGRTALFAASLHGKVSAIKVLLAHGVDGNAVDTAGWAPLHAASADGFVEAAELLLEHDVDKDAADNLGHTPTFVACQEGRVETATALSRAGASLGDVSSLRDAVARCPDFWPTYESACRTAWHPSNVDFVSSYADMVCYDGTDARDSGESAAEAPGKRPRWAAI